MSESLYDKYGGFATVSAIVQLFYNKVLDTDSLAPFFDGINMDRLMDHQVKFLCMALGGPNNYEGRSLAAAHRKLGIGDNHFGDVAQCLIDALTEGGMAKDDIDTVIGIVASKKDEIVTVRATG